LFELIFGAVLVLITAFVFYLGIHYIHETKALTQRGDTQFNKQDYVKKNREQFGASNRGTSMDGRNIYAKSPSDLGL
jgi:high-affinity Fe2+/Pb2+ permease